MSSSTASGSRSSVAFTVNLGAAMLAGAVVMASVLFAAGAPEAVAVGVVLATIPVGPVIGCYLWLDRYEPEPRSLLLLGLGWGAFVATSAAIGLPIALASTAGYILGGWNLPSVVPGALGYVVLPMLALIALASMSTAPLGARVAHATDIRKLTVVFAALLYALAVYMAWRGVTA